MTEAGAAGAAGTSAIGRARAKFILMGEHSVVYGHPAIAMPVHSLPLTVTATTTSEDRPPVIESQLFSGRIDRAPEFMAAPIAAIDAALARFGVHPRGLSLSVASEIPPARGLGSSAATAGALIHALAQLARAELTDATHFELVQVAERVAHGAPSGLDAVATRALVPIRFHRGITTALPKGLSGCFVLADTGVHGRTRLAVATVRERVDTRRQWALSRIERLGTLTAEAEFSLESADLASLGNSMNEAQELLADLGVSSVELDALVEAARMAGALGAKLTGGGQGGCMVVLVENRRAAGTMVEALERAGASHTWIYDTAEYTE